MRRATSRAKMVGDLRVSYSPVARVRRGRILPDSRSPARRGWGCPPPGGRLNCAGPGPRAPGSCPIPSRLPLKFVRKIVKEITVFLGACWFLVLLLALALVIYPVERQSEFWVWSSLSYVTSFLFYVLTIYLPERKNQKNIRRAVVPYIQSILSDTKGVFYTFLAAANQHCDIGNLREEDFHRLFKAINPQDRSTRLDFLGFVNWFQYLEHQKERVKRTVDRILTYEHYLDTEFILALEGLHNSTLFEILDFIENKPMAYTDFGFLADAYFQCYRQVDRLEAFLRKYTADV
jgi:hypothetical protein